MNDKELEYQVALTFVPNIGPVQSKILLEHFSEASAIFKATKKELSGIEGIGEIKASCIKKFADTDRVKEEIKFIEKNNIRPLFLKDEDYPKRLLNCYDPPTMLYLKGNADLNADKVISIVGSRHHTEYSRLVIENLVSNLKQENILVVSGLAFGVDALAHKAALNHHLQTVGALAHGLDMIYPPQHKHLATEMLLNGGLISEFPHGVKPDKHNFPRRNRIVAGMADAVIVTETAAKGGSMITAELAYNYNKDVFVFPGKITDAKSEGCNILIKQLKASLLTDTQQLLHAMGWQERKKQPVTQRQLFIELTEEEKVLVDVIQLKDATSIDEIHFQCALTSSAIAAALLNLELQGIIMSLPGKMYRMI